MSIFFPSMVANFKLSFDENLTVRFPLTPRQVQDQLAAGSAISVPTIEPLIVAKGRPNESFVLNRVPKDATVKLPGHRPAGNFNLTFDFRDIPIDPRTVRGGAVSIYLGAVAKGDFADGMLGRTNFFGSKPSVLDPSGFFGGRNSADLLMVGMIDEWQVEHGADGSEVHVSGRDLRGVLIDTPIATNPKLADQLLDSLNMAQPIQLVIKDILSKHVLFSGFKVRTSLSEWGGVPPSPGLDAMPRHRRGAKGTKVGGRASAPGSSDKISFWDLIVNLCYLVGAIPQIVGTELRIRPVRSLYDQKRAGFEAGSLTPFANGAPRVVDAQSGAKISPLSVRRMVYGRDVDAISFTRKFGGYYRPKQIHCVSLDASSFSRGPSRVIEGIWPEEARATRLSAGGQKSEAEVLYVRAPAAVRDQARLRLIAKALYEEIGRGELGGTCETKNLASFGGDNSDPDLLRLRPGDAVQFAADVRKLTKTAPLVSEYTDHLRKSVEQRIQEITLAVGDPNLARVIVTTSQGLVNLQDFFRVAGVTYSFGTEGLKVGFEFENFIEATFDAGGGADNGTPGVILEETVPAQGTNR